MRASAPCRARASLPLPDWRQVTSSMRGAALELVSLTKRFGPTIAVDHISLKIAPGTYCCLLGPSGCGKTSTLRMFAIFNRFDPRYEEAARDLGASPWQALRHVVLPIIGPSVVGIGLFGFTLSWDEIARTSQAVGYLNTLPLELQGQTTTVTTPVIYALGTLTTGVSLLVIAAALAAILLLRQRQGRAATDAPQGPL